MKRRIEILLSMIAMGMSFASIAGAISSAIVAGFTFAPDIVGIILGLCFGGIFGLIEGAMIGVVVGCAAGVVTILFDSQAEDTIFYKLCMMIVCSLLSAVLVFTQTQMFFDLERPIDRSIIYALTLLGTLSGMIISFIFANFYRRFILSPPDHAPSA